MFLLGTRTAEVRDRKSGLRFFKCEVRHRKSRLGQPSAGFDQRLPAR